ncbi:MAG: hypothetical protein KJ795_03660 [Gammaproteobacteria bacterium]|nr:hypothetical protein [Gammaproteobacteria bacterium]MBU1777269.1 hypothetical protein [Gammaproteobacteria bacterium]MBU1967868.1 hypothetical protein [Gammaproteobacteria bacterium]
MEKTKPGIESAVVAFLLAIFAAALMFPLVLAVDRVVTLLWHSGFDMSVLAQLLTGHSFKSLYLLLEIVAVWMFALISGVIPYALCIAIAREYRLHHWQYFVICGVLTAVGPSCLLMANLIDWRGLSLLNPVFWQQYLAMLPGCIASGAVAGYVCWRYLIYSMNKRRLESV